MWPFTSRRIMGNRWWALAFVVFVCWQAIELTGSSLPGEENATQTSATGEPVTDQQVHDLENGIKAM